MKRVWNDHESRYQNWAVLHFRRIPDLHHRGILFNRLRVLQTPWFGIYLHKLRLPDVERHLHNHPWNFVSLVLWRGYTETISAEGEWSKDGLSARDRTRQVRRRMLTVHRHPLSRYHAIREMPKPTWTLFFVGRRLQPWGYLTEAGWVPYDKYHSQPNSTWARQLGEYRTTAPVYTPHNDAEAVD